MYEQYTDKQIVEMLVPKLNKAFGGDWSCLFEYPKVYTNIIKAISLAYRSGYIRGQLGHSFIVDEEKIKKATEQWVPATKDNVKVGSKVRMIDEEVHRSKPWRFPDVGTVGTVTEVGFHTHLVQWPEGSTSRTDKWCCNDTRLEVLLCE